MELSKRMLPAILLCLLLLTATGMGPAMVEGKYCRYKSQMFRGLCFSDRNCANVCHNEGFSGGDCQGFRRRCYCLRPC